MSRRAELVAAALPVVAESGVSSMSLRPLAQALGTSDRMLIHYFGTREGLVSAILAQAFEELTEVRGGTTPGGAGTVPELWSALSSAEARPAVRLYLEVSALAHGNAAWQETLGPLTATWLSRLEGWLVEGGVAPARAPVLAGLVSATLDGCLLRLGTDGPSADLEAVVAELAALVEPARTPR